MNTLTLNRTDYYTPDELGPLLGVAKATLDKWRRSGQGPSFLKIGRTPWYPKADILIWMESKRKNVDRKKVKSLGLQIQGQSRGISRFNGSTGHQRKSGGS